MAPSKPLLFDELVALGCADVVPCPRPRPYVKSAVLLDPPTGAVYFPPFGLAGGMLVSVGGTAEAADFDALVEDARATKLNGAPARSDGCFYFPPGSLPAEYTSLTTASSRLREFAEVKAAEGDELLRKGLAEQALAAYELAAAFGRPEDYARMLLTSLPARRRARIWRLLAQVATKSPEQHVRDARAQIGYKLPVPPQRGNYAAVIGAARPGAKTDLAIVSSGLVTPHAADLAILGSAKSISNRGPQHVRGGDQTRPNGSLRLGAA